MFSSLLHHAPISVFPLKISAQKTHSTNISSHFLLTPYPFHQKLLTKSCILPSSCSSISCLGPGPNGSEQSESSGSTDEFVHELDRLLVLLPEEIRNSLGNHQELQNLIEVVMDLGRRPLARFPSGDLVLSDRAITYADLKQASSLVGDFAKDNRAGISRTLHRISAIRNRKGAIVGLTCRVGRAISGSANMIRDLVKDGDSLLLIGPPGVGKTTIIREVARILADDYKKRVIIVDTSNEIGGDGDIPHVGIGGARRMQVPNAEMQHKVLIEAVENHMPQVIVIDEIGTRLEALAASTIAQRGIQLVGSAHGVTIENLTKNPSLDILVGGIQSVTLGDEEASKRGVQKTVLERGGPPTFSCAVEIMSKTELRVHHSLEATVDSILAGRYPHFETRRVSRRGMPCEPHNVQDGVFSDPSSKKVDECIKDDFHDIDAHGRLLNKTTKQIHFDDIRPIRLYTFGFSGTNVKQAVKLLGMEDLIHLTNDISKASAVLASNYKFKKGSQVQEDAKYHRIPIFLTKTSSLADLTRAIQAMFGQQNYVTGSAVGNDNKDGLVDESRDRRGSSEEVDALEETRLAIEDVVIPKGQIVELLPRSPNIIALQMDLIQNHQLHYEKVGEDPNLKLRIFPYYNAEKKEPYTVTETTKTGIVDEPFSHHRSMNYPGDIVTRLPLLSD
ncbi:uncharacterized protein ycf45 [Amborella trichopoda]|nr:uncharacterized protein ycf45 [Amborella trichopoda]|eukprot:XP_006852501.2 uncharacterized protein ycf45 [Amborella trichopoda]